jgi:DNA-binding transcriptional regulator LsrR (DeoR family)
MMGVDKIGEIRRAYFEQHRSIKEIVRTLSVSRATVRKVVRPVDPRGPTQRPSGAGIRL